MPVRGMGIVVGLVLAVESIPLGILVGALLDSSLRRRARFALRLAMFAMIQTAPAVVLIVGLAFRVLGEQAVGELLAVCVLSVFVSPVLMPVLLFPWPDRRGSSGENDDEGHGPGPGGDGPLAPRPTGGVPLPDAEPSPVRARGPLPLAPFRWPRRPAREPDRTPSRLLSALRCRWLWGTSG
jgi:F0F1-type ATP synthase membrane subunit c/vacuolar-type H+-ATPase subunit K